MVLAGCDHCLNARTLPLTLFLCFALAVRGSTTRPNGVPSCDCRSHGLSVGREYGGVITCCVLLLQRSRPARDGPITCCVFLLQRSWPVRDGPITCCVFLLQRSRLVRDGPVTCCVFLLQRPWPVRNGPTLLALHARRARHVWRRHRDRLHHAGGRRARRLRHTVTSLMLRRRA